MTCLFRIAIIVLAIASIVLVYQKSEKPPEAISPAEKKAVAVDDL
ncbi:hypothetical protein ACFLV5_03985 [Chloroflexota bacterium]